MPETIDDIIKVVDSINNKIYLKKNNCQKWVDNSQLTPC